MATQIDKTTVIAELQRVAQILNTQYLSRDDYKKLGTISCSTVENRFGSWTNALQAAGLQPATAKERKFLTDEDLLVNIIAVTRKLKKIPSEREMAAHGKYSMTPYLDRWGSLSKACNVAYKQYGLPSEVNAVSTTTAKARSQLSKGASPKVDVSGAVNDLKPHLLKIANADTRNFVEEAIKCLEAGLYRSAVVMSWIGAMAVLYDHVLAYRLNDFNMEAQRRDQKWKTAITKDDLALMKESEFLDILAALSIIGKNVKEQLKNNCLGLRNACGHPTSFKLGRSMVENHLETLLLNVYDVF